MTLGLVLGAEVECTSKCRFGKIMGAFALCGLCAGWPDIGAAEADWIPYKCCPKTDCQASDGVEVQEVRGGYRVEGVDELIAFGDARVQLSRDGHFHACVRSQALPSMSVTQAFVRGQQKQVKCLFVPLSG